MNQLENLAHFLGENRVEYIASKQGQALMRAYIQDTGPGKPKNLKTPEQVLQVLVKGDPSKNTQYLQWLATHYAKQEFSLEDVERVKSDLSDFMRVGRRLPNKDLNSYTLDKLYAAMEPFLSDGRETSTKIMKKWQPTPEEQRMIDAGEIRLIYEDDQVKVFVPTSFPASCHLGSGTKWCTAWSHQPSHFNTYSKKGPLYVIFTPDGKFQFHFENSMFMNAQDRPAELGVLIERYPQLQNVFKDLAEKHGVLGLLKNPSEDVMMTAVTKHPVKIKELRPSILTSNIVTAAMDNVEKYTLKEVFNHIMHVRPDLVTDNIRLLAIKADPSTIKSIPLSQLTYEQANAATKGKDAIAVHDAYSYIVDSKPKFVDEQIKINTLGTNGNLLQSMNTKNSPVTKDMVKAALSDTSDPHALTALGWAMKNVPQFVTDKQLMELVNRDRTTLKYVPEDRQTQEIVEAALKHDVGSFVHVRNPTEEMIIAALVEGPYLARDNKYIKQILTTDLMKKVAEQNPMPTIHEFGGILDSEDSSKLPSHVDLKKVITHGLSYDGMSLKYVKRQTPEMIKAAVKQNPRAWDYADSAVVNKDPELQKEKRKHDSQWNR